MKKIIIMIICAIFACPMSSSLVEATMLKYKYDLSINASMFLRNTVDDPYKYEGETLANGTTLICWHEEIEVELSDGSHLLKWSGPIEYKVEWLDFYETSRMGEAWRSQDMGDSYYNMLGICFWNLGLGGIPPSEGDFADLCGSNFYQPPFYPKIGDEPLEDMVVIEISDYIGVAPHRITLSNPMKIPEPSVLMLMFPMIVAMFFTSVIDKRLYTFKSKISRD